MILSTKLYGLSHKVGIDAGLDGALRSNGQEQLEHSFIVETEVAVATDNDMVQNAHAHNVTDFF